jgi:hypothetical protein
MEAYVPGTLAHVRGTLKPLVPMEDTTLVAQLLRNLQVPYRVGGRGERLRLRALIWSRGY